MLISLISSAFLLPWSATLITQVRRAEGGRHTPIVWLQTVGFGAFVILFVYPEMVWALAAFRPNVSAELVRGFNDFAWLGFVCIVSTGMIQMFALGWVVLRDRRPDPIYPRWFGYFNLWVWTLFIPADLIFFFKTGPFAWNVIFGFGLSFGAYFAWTLTVTIMTGRAVNRQAAEGEEPEAIDVNELAAQYASLQRTVDQLLAERTATQPAGTAAATISARELSRRRARHDRSTRRDPPQPDRRADRVETRSAYICNAHPGMHHVVSHGIGEQRHWATRL
ncbi:MAG: hypothetical protein ACYDHH_16260 [Solirubrobacteraceae bacterium]